MMMSALITSIWLLSPESSAFVASMERGYLTEDDGQDHINAAQAAGEKYNIAYNFLLAIMDHETGGQRHNFVTPEPRDPRTHRRRWSCGPMTPVPKTSGCSKEELTLEGGYMAGAEHLRMYLDMYHDMRLALVAYAGGPGSVRYPKAGWRAWQFMRWIMRRQQEIHDALDGLPVKSKVRRPTRTHRHALSQS